MNTHNARFCCNSEAHYNSRNLPSSLTTISQLPDFSSQGYQLNRELGHNYVGRVTYLATYTKTQHAVVIKQFQSEISLSKRSRLIAKYCTSEQHLINP